MLEGLGLKWRVEVFLHGAQSYETCIVAGAVMAKEKEAMKSRCFTSIIDFVKKVENEGIPATEVKSQSRLKRMV